MTLPEGTRPFDYVDELAQIRIGLVKAWAEVSDRRIEWSLVAALELVDREIDAHADVVHPKTSLGQYLAFRVHHHPGAIPDDLSDLT